MPSILLIAGTRPEIIKMAPVLLAARARSDVHARFCATGQHQQMAEEAMRIFGIRPDHDLGIMKPGQSLNDVCQAIFEKLPPVIAQEKPDVLLVQGDTTSAAAAGIAAFNMGVPVGHVEAGLRSHDLTAPYPEEANRRIIGVVGRYHFCPTDHARQNLLREGADPSTVFVTGNTVVDALEGIRARHPLDDPGRVVPGLSGPYVLITAHRRESFGQGFRDLCTAIRQCAVEFPQVRFIYPVHLNPNVQAPVRAILDGLSNVALIPPVPYLELLTLLKHCTVVLTDSGGIQEEAPSFGKFCIVMRRVTERMESVEQGMSALVGTEPTAIVQAVRRALTEPVRVNPNENPYGDGRASDRILDLLTKR